MRQPGSELLVESSNSGDEPPRLSVQELVFRREGPMPPARLSQRLIAFLLDAILLGAISVLVVFRLVLPMTHPLELELFFDWMHAYQEAGQLGEERPGLEILPTEVWRMLILAQNLIMITFWVYFAAADTFAHGRTLGKRTFRLKVVHRITLGPPDLRSAFIRATIKTLCLFTLFPFALINFVLVFFLKFQRAGHDALSKTLVVEDNPPPPKPPPP